MHRCPNCNKTFKELKDLLTHFVQNGECRTKALTYEMELKSYCLIFATCYGRIGVD
jgi:uncharacterized C2H2 Zn-finger protein